MTAIDPVRDLLRSRGCADRAVEGGLEGLLEAWERVAETLEGGYALGLDDYLNDLDVRELLDAVILLATDRDRTKAAKRLAAIDTRVRSATEPAGRCLWGERVARSHGWTLTTHWWYYVRPRRMGTELRADLGDA